MLAHHARSRAFLIFNFAFLPAIAHAHERWMLTPQEIAHLNSLPRPDIFIHLNAVNLTMYAFTLLFLVGWVLLNRTGARELFPDLQVRLLSYGGYASLGLRIALFILLGMAGFGLGPRAGTALWEAPTLAAPDLELRSMGPGWEWIAWVEVALAVCFLFGIYVRGAAIVLLALAILGFYLAGIRMIDYAGLIGGAAVYLLLQGAGSLYVPMPAFPGTARISTCLANQPRLRAQWLLNILAGFNLIYLGVAYKFFQPNLILAILAEHHVPTFGIDPPTFVLWMALVESLSGVLIMAGVLMRFLSIFLFASFVFFSVILGEGVFGHIIFYGLLVSFITNGEGQWRRPVARDKPGRIVVVGGGFAGVHSVMRLERLLGSITNVTVTLIHHENCFLFQPLLPEVVGGAVQPGSIVNSIRRVCPKTNLLLGEVTLIDAAARCVQVTLPSAEKRTVDYDQLVIALDPEASFTRIPGLLEHALPMMTVGDALFLRQQVLQRLEDVTTLSDPGKRPALLTFSVIGGGTRGASTAAGIRALLNGTLVSYDKIGRNEPRVLLFEETPELLSQFGSALGSAARRRLQKLGVESFIGTKVAAVTPEEVVLSSGQRIPCRTVVGALTSRPQVVADLPWARSDGRLAVDEFLRVQGAEHVWAAGDCGAIGQGTPAFEARGEIKMGRLVAYNALASHRGYKLHRWPERKPRVSIAALGRDATVGRFFGIPFGGIPAWIVSRIECLLTLPGLERNLRVLIDWMLDIPFRNDLVVLAPQPTHKLGRAHYEPGDEVIRQGERGDCAYLILKGEVEVLREADGHRQQVARLKSGECFGEVALLAQVPRTATVRCLTAVDLLVLPRAEFMTLAQGYGDFGEALKARMTERAKNVDSFHGIRSDGP